MLGQASLELFDSKKSLKLTGEKITAKKFYALGPSTESKFHGKNHPNIYLSNNSLEQAEWNSMLFKLSLIMEGSTEKVSQFKMTLKSRIKFLF